MLVARAQAGDELARNEIVTHFWLKVRTYSDDERGDLAERLIKVLQSGRFDTSRNVGTIYGFVFRMMKNLYIGGKRQQNFRCRKERELNPVTVEQPKVIEIGATDIDDPTIALLARRARERGGIEGVFTAVAAELGVSRQTLYKRIKRFRETHQLSDFV